MPSPDSGSPVLTRGELVANTLRVVRPASGAKPAIILAQAGDHRVIVKDFAPCQWLMRSLYGRWVVGHETAIYQRLVGVEGVPAFRGRLDAFAFATDFVGGATLKEMRRKSVDADVFEQLDALHDAIHARGVVHLDAHQKKNILVTKDGRVHLVDFASSMYMGSGWLARRVVVPLLGRADRLGVHKLKARYCSQEATRGEAWKRRVVWMVGNLWPVTAARRLYRWLRRRVGRGSKAQGDEGD